MKPYKKTIVRHHTPDGRRCASTDPGAVRSVEESGNYYGNVNGRPVALCPDFARSKTILRQLLGDAAAGRLGVGDAYAKHNAAPIASHLADYRRHLERKENTAGHCDRMVRNVECVLGDLGVTLLPEIDADAVAEALALRRKGRAAAPPPGKEFTLAQMVEALGVTADAVRKAIRTRRLAATGSGRARRFPRATLEELLARRSRGSGAETFNHYVRSLRAFGRWLYKAKRAPSNPFDSLGLLHVGTDRRHRRRALDGAEAAALLRASAAAGPFRGLTGTDRRALYLLALVTGFRRRALAGLTPAHFDLGGDHPAVSLPPRLAKNKRGLRQHLALPLAAELAPYLRGRPRDMPVWPGTWAEESAEMLAADLHAAGIDPVTRDQEGELHVDFHALRHATGTLCKTLGIDADTRRQILGHASSSVTDRYVHTDPDAFQAAAEKLFAAVAGTPKPASRRKGPKSG